MEYIKIGNIAKSIVSGGTPKSTKAEYYNGNIPWLNTKEINFNRIYRTEKCITTEGLKNSSAKYIKENCVIIAMYGATAGRAAINKISLTTNQACCNIEVDSSKMDYNYVYYAIKNDYEHLSSLANGGAQQNLNSLIIKDFEIPYVNLYIQKKISKILTSIDKKIELNNEINNNLSEQLKMIFYEWFESKMDDDLPDDWKIVDLQDVATFSQGVQVPIEEQIEQEKDGFVRFIRIVDITQGSDKEIRFIEDRDRGHVVENEIFMTRYGTPGILSRNYNGIIANNLFKITPSDGVTSNYLFSALNVDRIQKYIKGNATSSTMPAISFSILNNQKVIIPDRETLGKFDEYSETVRKKQLNIINENKRLEQLRDTLLPKLMNGEIDLDNIEI